MKLRQNGMPDEEYWETLLDVPLILDRLEIDLQLGDVVEVGAGYGTFTIPAARRISGVLRPLTSTRRWRVGIIGAGGGT